MKYAIGIDLGGTKIEGVLINENGKILEKIRVPTEANKSKRIILNNLCNIIDNLKSKKIVGIGIGVPGFVNNNKVGIISNIPKLNNFDIADFLNKKYRCKVFVENDGSCFALSESIEWNKKYFLGIVWGTGIGSCMVVNNEIYKGNSGKAGEIGHIKVDSMFGKEEVEKLASGPGIEYVYDKLSGKRKDIYYIMKKKDPYCQKAIDMGLDAFAKGIAFAIACYDPEIIVIGGGMSNTKNFSKIRELVKIYSPFNCSIEKYKCAESGSKGAGLLVFR